MAVLIAAALPAAVVGVGTGAEKSPPASGDIAMSVQPSETIVVSGGESKTITLTNTGAVPTKYFMAIGNFDIDPEGSVRINPPLTPSRSAADWLKIDPPEVSLGVGKSAKIRVRATPSRSASAGDHGAIALFVTDVANQGQARFRGRIGVPMIVRVRGPLVRKVAIGRISVSRSGKSRVVRVRVINNGNVSERFTRQRISIQLLRGGRTVARLTARTRLFLPGTRGDILGRYNGRLRGRVVVRVTLTPAAPPEAGPGIASVTRPIVRRATVRF